MAAINGTAGNDTLNGGSGDDEISGLGGDDLIRGGSGNDHLNGGAGGDRLYGGAGDDTYYVDSLADRVFESSGSGTDLVFSSVSFSLYGQYIDNLTLTGTGATSGTGNSLANILTGNNAANVLNGAGGADVMRGRGGDDVYYVGDAADQVIELAGQGTDTVNSSISYTLSANVEHLTLTGTGATSATGNALRNTLTGNAAANVLDGAAGGDTMRGGAGGDTYVVDDLRDVVVEAAGKGTDTVRSSISFKLGANVENLSLTGSSAINGSGNELGNTLVGNGYANVLDGGSGADVLTGGGGRDTFAFTSVPGSSNIDRIADFQPGLDKILLAGAAGSPFAGLASGTLGAAAFHTGATAHDADDRIIYDRATGSLFYDADGSGSGAAVQFATIAPKLSVAFDNFSIAGAPNNLPTISSGPAVTVEENISTSAAVYQIAGTDPDGDSIVFSLAGADAASFRLDGTGAVRFAASPDFETKSSYSFTVMALDSSGAGASREVTVSIADVAEGLRVVQETSAFNDTPGSAQPLSRDLLKISFDPNLPDASLPSLRIVGALSSTSDGDFFSVELGQGELLVLDVDGTPTLDSLVNIIGPGGGIVASNDDLVSFDPGSAAHPGVSHNQDSFLRFRAPTSGTYVFSIQAFDDGSGATTSGDYEINVSIGPPAPREALDDENVEALLSGDQWLDFNLTYGFASSPSDYPAGQWDAEVASGFQPLNAQQQATVRAILGQVANLTNLSFAEISPGQAQMRYALSAEPETAYAAYPGSGEGGDSWYNNAEYTSPVVGNYEWTTFIHETGHALGLKHAQESPAVSADRDSLEYSVMTYRSYIGAAVGEPDGGYTNETWGYPQTLMMYDIAALQRLYGADFSANSADTVYRWSPTTGAFQINGVTQWTPGANRVFMTLWDGGGTDTYDLSQYSVKVTIDLRPGEWSMLSHVQRVNLGDDHYARGQVANALLFNGDTRSLIENAVGGSDNDVIIANQAVNRLTGGPGTDQFRWNSLSDSPAASPDIITDYGPDQLNFAGIDAIPATPGDDAFTLLGTNAFTGRAGEIRWEPLTDRILILADVDGDAAADLQVIAMWTDTSQPWIPNDFFIL